MRKLINKIQGTVIAGTGVLISLVTITASAVPTLQLDIVGGSYDSGTQTVETNSDVFSLVAYGKDGSRGIVLADDYYISIAVLSADINTPFLKTTDMSGFGSFDFAGSTYDLDNLAWGTPPTPTVASNEDLQSHSIYPSFFAQSAFNFAGDLTSSVNTQDNTGTTPTSGCSSTCLYYQTFLVDVTNMSGGINLHFDLFHLDTNGEVDGFAPFSHDAAYVPEPASLALLGLSLFVLGFSRHRKHG